MFMLRRTALAVAVLAMGLLGTWSKADEVDKYMPAEAEIVINFNLKGFLDSSIIKEKVPELITKFAGPVIGMALESPEVKGKLGGNEDAVKQKLSSKEELRKAFGEAGAKVQKIIVAGENGEGEDKDNVVVIVRGEFDAAEVSQGMDALGKMQDGVIKKVEGQSNTWEIDMQGGKKGYLTVPEKGVILFSPAKEYFTETLKAAGETSAKKQDEDVKEMLKSVNQKSSIWGVGTTEKQKDVKNFTVEVMTDEALNIKMRMGFESASEAEKKVTEINQQLQGLPQMLDAFVPNPTLANAIRDVLKSVKVSQAEKNVNFEMSITKDNLDAFMK